jgi:hypothetical protein
MTSCIVDKPPIFGLTGSADLSSDSESDVYTKPTEPMAGEHEKTNAVDNMSEYESQLPPHDNEFLLSEQ